MAVKKEFLGKGMKFPPQINPATGRFMTAEGEQSIKESVYLILMTQKSERILLPNFGSKLMSYTFMDTSATALNIMAQEIRRDIMANEPRIADVNIDIDSEMKKGCLIVNIEYLIRNTNIRDNLVFPFYLDTTWDEDEEERPDGVQEIV